MGHSARLLLPYVVIALLAIVMLGSPRPTEEARSEIQLPVVGECGVLPLDTEAVHILITKDATFQVRGGPPIRGIRDLATHLRELRSEIDEDLGVQSKRSLDIAIEADARASWGAVGSVLLLSRAVAGAERFWFLVRNEADGKVGVIRYGPGRIFGTVWHGDILEIRLRRATARTEPGRIYAAVTAWPELVENDWWFEIGAAEPSALDVPWGDVLSMFHVFLRTGARTVCLVTPGTEGSFPGDALASYEAVRAFLGDEERVLTYVERVVATHRRTQGRAAMDWNGPLVPLAGSLPPPKPRHHGAWGPEVNLLIHGPTDRWLLDADEAADGSGGAARDR